MSSSKPRTPPSHLFFPDKMRFPLCSNSAWARSRVLETGQSLPAATAQANTKTTKAKVPYASELVGACKSLAVRWLHSGIAKLERWKALPSRNNDMASRGAALQVNSVRPGAAWWGDWCLSTASQIKWVQMESIPCHALWYLWEHKSRNAAMTQAQFGSSKIMLNN